MYKHLCVKCLREHGLTCIWHIGFFDRFFGTDKIKYCPEFNNIQTYQKKYNKKDGKK